VVIKTPDGSFYFYRLGYGTGNTTGCYLQVLVRYYEQGSGSIQTAWFTPVTVEGEVKWFKPS